MTDREVPQARQYAIWIMRASRRWRAGARPALAAAYWSVKRSFTTDLRNLFDEVGSSLQPLSDYAMRRLERAHARFMSDEEKQRVAKELEEYANAGSVGIDLLRAAAMWAGAGVESYELRRTRYRILVAAIRRGDITGAVRFRGHRAGPDPYTRLPLREFKSYLVRIGVLLGE